MHNKGDEFAADWESLHCQMTGAMRELISATVDRHAPDLASLFYNYMEADKDAVNHSPLTTHQQKSLRPPPRPACA